MASVSPDGTDVATIETVDGRGSIFLRKADGSSTLIYRDPERSINNVRWSSDGRWLLFLQDAGGDEGYHLFRLDPTKPGPPTDLTPFSKISAELVPTPVGRDAPLLVAINRRDAAYPDVFAVDPSTGKLNERFRNTGKFIEYFADGSGNILAAVAISDSGVLTVNARRTPDAPFEAVYSAPADERFKALSVTAAGNALLARSNRGQEAERLLSIPLAKGKARMIGTCGRYDVEDVIQNTIGVIGVVCITDRAQITALSSQFQRTVKTVSKLVGREASLSLESRSQDGSTTIFYSDRSDRPGRFVIVRNGIAASFAETRPWLAESKFAVTKPITIEARDGLLLSGYVTRPPGAKSAGPTILAVHGGPWTRDSAGFERETQFYASRGYNVLQVNFRGSTGLGKRLFEAAVGEFGMRMSEDLDDAVAHGIKSGWIDPARVCILGGSYGGYAAMRAISRVGGFGYRCAVNYAGPVDLATLIEAFPPSWAPYLPRSWYRFVGNPSDARARATMKGRSPLTDANRIAVPLLVFQGANDPRVTQAQSDAIVCSLRRRGVAVEYLLAANEGHSFGNEETSMAVNYAVEQFFAQHLGGLKGPAPDAAVTTTAAELRRGGASVDC